MYCVNPACPDVEATGQPMEYADGIDRCPVCGEPLVASPPAIEEHPRSEPTPPPAGDDEVTVHTTTSLGDLALIEAALDEADIPFVRRERHLSGLPLAMGSIAPAPGVEYRIAVTPDASQQAQQLLTDLATPVDLPTDDPGPIEPGTLRSSVVPFVIGGILAVFAFMLLWQLLTQLR